MAKLKAISAIAASLLIELPAIGNAIAQIAPYRVVADEVTDPLDGIVGDAERGRLVVLDRNVGNCLICHAVPEPRERFMGDIGPDLAGVGARLGAGQIRLRLIDASRVDPSTIMPPYHRIDGLLRVGAPWRDKPVLTSRQVEDAVAYLATLTAVK